MRQAGRLPGEAVWRWELRLRGEALQLRKRGRGEIVVDFRRCATLADQPAIARVWAYAFGNAESDRPNGHYRLAVAAERFDDQGRGVPLTRTRAVDPLWRVVLEAGGQTPIETLAQVRERREAARADWPSKAEDVLLRGLAASVALDHPDDARAAADAALERARELVTSERWAAAHELQVAATDDLRNTDDDESTPNPPNPEPEPNPHPNEADMTTVNKRKFVANTATGTLTLDTRYFPVLIATWLGEMSPELVDRYFALRNPITQHADTIGAKVFVITDISAMDLPTATQRKYVANRAAETGPKCTSLLGYAVVARARSSAESSRPSAG